jgi:hypothetical protein
VNHEDPGSDGSSSVAANRRFYDALWSASYLVPPQRFNTWPLLSGLAAAAPARLEIGPGLRPRLPAADTHFVDVSRPALSRLKDRGGLLRQKRLAWGPGLIDVAQVDELLLECGRSTGRW